MTRRHSRPRDHRVELPLEQLQLILTSRERRSRPPRHRSDAAHLEEPVGLHRLGLSLGGERRDRLRPHRATDEPKRPLPEQHLARAGVLLQPRGDVDRVAGDERLAARGVAGHHLAGVDADPQCDRVSDPPLELLVEHRETGLHLQRRTARSQSVVLVRLGHAEDGEHRIADELLHRAPVPLERTAHLVEVREHQAANRLGIDQLAERRGSREIAEHERCELPPLDRGWDQRGSAVAAMAKALGALAAAGRTGQHRDKPTTSREATDSLRLRPMDPASRLPVTAE